MTHLSNLSEKDNLWLRQQRIICSSHTPNFGIARPLIGTDQDATLLCLSYPISTYVSHAISIIRPRSPAAQRSSDSSCIAVVQWATCPQASTVFAHIAESMAGATHALSKAPLTGSPRRPFLVSGNEGDEEGQKDTALDTNHH